MRQKVPGRKRGLAVDVLGLVLAASVHNATDTGTVEKARVDQGFKNAVVAHGEKVGIEVEIVERNPAGTGFVPIPERWIVERAYGILMLHRASGPPPLAWRGRGRRWRAAVLASRLVLPQRDGRTSGQSTRTNSG